MKNNKGFTLVEILATITIIAVLSVAAIPVSSKYIKSSRQNAYVQLAKNYIKEARLQLTDKRLAQKTNANLVCKFPPLGKYTLLSIENIELEQATIQSPFKKEIKTSSGAAGSYVIVVNVGTSNNGTGKDKYVYFFAGIDKGKNGIEQFVAEDELKKSYIKVKTGKTTYKTNLGSTTNKINISSGKYSGTYSMYMECGGSY